MLQINNTLKILKNKVFLWYIILFVNYYITTSIMLSKTQEHRFKFDSEFSFEQRKAEADRIRQKYSDRVPIIVEPEKKCQIEIDKKKYLVPNDLTIGQFLYVIRKRLKLPAEKSLFLFVKSHVPASSTLLSILYEQYADSDGFLKVTYNEENVFG